MISWTDTYRSLLRKKEKRDPSTPRMCYCIGPQNGQTLCPCRMRWRNEERRVMREEILEEIRRGKGT